MNTPIANTHGAVSPGGRFLPRLLLLAVLSGLSSSFVSAAERSPLDVVLTAQHFVRDAAGAEVLCSDPAVEPGEVVQYTAVYRNTSGSTLHNLAPTVPIPAGMEFVPGSAQPAPVAASVDGRTFEPYPVRRSHVLPDGTKIEIEVPASAYRALRWHPTDLAAGRALTANLRACVTSDVASR